MGTRLLLTEGISPYDHIVSKQIRDKSEELYGQKQPAKSAQVFYPLYSGLIYFPYALIEDYLLAHSLWMTTLEIALIGLAIACLKVTRWRVPAIMFVLYFFFCLFWIHSIMPLITGNVVIIVALCLTLSVLAIRSGYDELAGILLAVSTIKPLVAIWLIVFLFIFAVRRGHFDDLEGPAHRILSDDDRAAAHGDERTDAQTVPSGGLTSINPGESRES